MSGRFKKMRKKFWESDPHCMRCGVPTILPEHLPCKIDTKNGFKIKETPSNMATIQHRYSKKHPLRRDKESMRTEQRYYLWCFKCNQQYNKDYENKL